MICRKGAIKTMPNILKNKSWKEVTDGSASENSVAMTMHPNTYLGSLTQCTKFIKLHRNRQQA